MERYRFGKGDYKYFRYPLPGVIESVRTATYPHLAKIANRWSDELGSAEEPFPLDHKDFLKRCHQAGQKHAPRSSFTTKPEDTTACTRICTERSLSAATGCHARPARTRLGRREFVLVENGPRAQSHAEVVTVGEGHGIVFTTRYRPVKGSRGNVRVSIRHGVSRVRRGTRYTLGIIYHDAK